MGTGIQKKKAPARPLRATIGRKKVRLQASRPKRAPRKTTPSKPRRAAPVVPAFHIPPILLEGDPLPEPIVPSLEAAPEAPLEKVVAAEKTAGEASTVVSDVKAQTGPEVSAKVELSPATAPDEVAKASSRAGVELTAVAVAPAGLSDRQEDLPKAENVVVPVEVLQPKASLWLSPRDPHSLLVSWEWQIAPPPGHPAIGLRLFEGQAASGEPFLALELPGDVSHRFLSVGKGNTWFTAQMGFFQSPGQWISLAEAIPVHTPSDQISPMTEVMVTQKVNESKPASLPPISAELPQLSGIEVPAPTPYVEAAPKNSAVSDLLSAASSVSATIENQPAPQVAAPLCVGESHTAQAKPGSPPALVQPEQFPVEKAAVVGQPGISAQVEPASIPVFPQSVAFQQPLGASERWISSLEWAKQQGAPPAMEQTQPGPIAPSSLSGPPEQAPGKGKDFWLVAEVELIVYGATEPGSRVTLAGAEVPLRPDGSFSCRLALPAGRHEIPIHAVSPAGDDSRQVGFLVCRA